jgi:hypothetical protein
VLIRCEGPIEGKNEVNCLFKIDVNRLVTLVGIKDEEGREIHYSIDSYKMLNNREME